MLTLRFIILELVFVTATIGGAQAQLSPGDMNCDGVADGFDIAPFVDCLLTGNCPPAHRAAPAAPGTAPAR